MSGWARWHMLAAAALLLSGCGVEIGPRYVMGRARTGKDALGPDPQNRFSFPLAVQFMPVRDSGVFVGAEIETGACFKITPRCPRAVEIRNGSLRGGYTILPGHSGRYLPGVEWTILAGAGQPAGEQMESSGTRYHLALGTALVIPTAVSDLRSGFVIVGTALDVLVTGQSGMWFPAAGPERAVTLENSLGLALRFRVSSDALLANGYPRARRSE